MDCWISETFRPTQKTVQGLVWINGRVQFMLTVISGMDMDVYSFGNVKVFRYFKEERTVRYIHILALLNCFGCGILKILKD